MSDPSSPLSVDDVKKRIADDLAAGVDIPGGHRGALVSFLNLDHVELAVATRVLKTDKVEWNVELLGTHDWVGNHDTSFGVLNKITW